MPPPPSALNLALLRRLYPPPRRLLKITTRLALTDLYDMPGCRLRIAGKPPPVISIGWVPDPPPPSPGPAGGRMSEPRYTVTLTFSCAP